MTESNQSEHQHTNANAEHAANRVKEALDEAFEHAGKAFESAGKAFEHAARTLLPPDAALKHFREARLEVLRGIRTIIDHRIEHLSRHGAQGTRVVVD